MHVQTPPLNVEHPILFDSRSCVDLGLLTEVEIERGDGNFNNEQSRSRAAGAERVANVADDHCEIRLRLFVYASAKRGLGAYDITIAKRCLHCLGGKKNRDVMRFALWRHLDDLCVV